MSSTLTFYGLPRGQVAAIVAVSAIVPAVLLMAPAIAEQLGAQLGLGPGQVGTMFSSELAAMSLATIPAWWWQKRVDWRLVAVAAALLFIVANIASAFAVAYTSLLVLRFISALGGGTLMVICMASAAGSTERDRVYGIWVCGQLVLGALGLWMLPRLFTVYGLSALYIGLAVLMVLCFPLLKQFPLKPDYRKKEWAFRKQQTLARHYRDLRCLCFLYRFVRSLGLCRNDCATGCHRSGNAGDDTRYRVAPWNCWVVNRNSDGWALPPKRFSRPWLRRNDRFSCHASRCPRACPLCSCRFRLQVRLDLRATIYSCFRG